MMMMMMIVNLYSAVRKKIPLLLYVSWCGVKRNVFSGDLRLFHTGNVF